MRNKRSVDEMSIEELERVLAIKKREARQQQLRRMQRDGRVVSDAQQSASPAASQPAIPPDPAPFALPDVPTVNAPAAAPEAAPNGDLTPSAANGTNGHAAAPGPRPIAPRFADEPGDLAQAIPRETGNSAWKRFMNVALLLVEVAAIAGLLFIGVQMVSETNRAREESNAAQQMVNDQREAAMVQPSPTPTVRLNDVVLPGGHYLVEGGGWRPAIEEIPASYRPLLQNELYQPVLERPEPTDETPLRLIIDSLGIDQLITQGTDLDALQRGVGQVLNGATPNQPGSNVVLAAHNDIFGEIFRYLPDLEIGDTFQIQTRNQTYTYAIIGYEQVEPTDVHVMDPTPGVSTATLITCYPYGVNSHRWIVYAELIV